MLSLVTARLFAASLLLLPSMSVWAQAEQQVATPAPETGRWVGVIIAVFFLIATAIGSFMTPKRTHLD